MISKRSGWPQWLARGSHLSKTPKSPCFMKGTFLMGLLTSTSTHLLRKESKLCKRRAAHTSCRTQASAALQRQGRRSGSRMECWRANTATPHFGKAARGHCRRAGLPHHQQLQQPLVHCGLVSNTGEIAACQESELEREDNTKKSQG